LVSAKNVLYCIFCLNPPPSAGDLRQISPRGNLGSPYGGNGIYAIACYPLRIGSGVNWSSLHLRKKPNAVFFLRSFFPYVEAEDN